MKRFDNRVYLISGGARGLGAAQARRLVAEGARVLLGDVLEDAGRALAAELGPACRFERLDVTDEAQWSQAVAAAEGLGEVHGLVNNAGVVDVAQRVDEMSLARLQRMFAINVFGSMLCAREAVRRMSTRFGGSGGAIVNVSSVAARLGSPGQYVDYAAAKAAVDTFTHGLALEVAAEGVRVNAVRPGIVETDIHASGGQPDRAWRLAPLVPMQRPGQPDEIAAAIVWLLSGEASYATGAILDIGGGR